VSSPAGTLFTVGHSTRPIEEFLSLLAAHGVAVVVDVRRFPGSRRYPQFGKDALAAALGRAGVDYVHEEELGGRREAVAADSPNRAWRNASFRAYADHMASPSFRAALDRLLSLANERPAAVMCAEAVPWRCHRQLIADAAVARGWRVLHILSAERADPHELHADARVRDDGTVVYPLAEDDQGRLL
jgi:uncharacterized protein (DUF488 family)